MFDRRASGTEVIGGAHKWVMNANWKYAADNFFGDDGHHTITAYVGTGASLSITAITPAPTMTPNPTIKIADCR